MKKKARLYLHVPIADEIDQKVSTSLLISML